MPSFILRDIDPTLWRQVKTKAAAEGITVKDLIFKLLTQWLAALLVLSLGAGCAYHAPTEPTRVAIVPSNAPASIQILGGTRSSSVVDIVARVFTADGRFLTGVTVTFTAFPGVVSPESAVTDGAGRAAAVLTTTGTSKVTATAGALSTSTTFP